MDCEVIDKTSVEGRFDIHLKVTPADLQPKFVARRTVEPKGQPTADNTTAGPPILTVLQQQLGLKLEAGRGVQALVEDHIERLTDN